MVSWHEQGLHIYYESLRKAAVSKSSILEVTYWSSSATLEQTGLGQTPDYRRLGLGTLADRHAIAHHGELLQGVFEDDRGCLHRGLVTLPLDRLRSTADLVLEEGGHLSVEPRGRVKPLRAAQLAAEHSGYPELSGRPRYLGHGYGSSTADEIASIRAVAATAGERLVPGVRRNVRPGAVEAARKPYVAAAGDYYGRTLSVAISAQCTFGKFTR